MAATLDPAAKKSAQRQSDFDAILARLDGDSDPIHETDGRVDAASCAGLFAGDDTFDQIHDNLDLERWFRLPKGHERRIHGHRHAGVRIVQEGPTLVHALDAHHTHPEPFGVDDLLPYRSARAPPCQRQAIHRRKVMRKARSKTKRPKLLAELERRYREATRLAQCRAIAYIEYVTEQGDSCGKIKPFFPTRRRRTPGHSLVARGAQRQSLQACLPDGAMPVLCLLSLISRNSPRKLRMVYSEL